jgi:hypothetical protein
MHRVNLQRAKQVDKQLTELEAMMSNLSSRDVNLNIYKENWFILTANGDSEYSEAFKNFIDSVKAKIQNEIDNLNIELSSL